MDFTSLTDDEIANAAKALFDSLHARQTAHAEGPFKVRFGRLLGIAHAALDQLRTEAVAAAVITPDTGGDPKIP